MEKKLDCKSNKIQEYDTLRVVVTVLVLFSHCLYYKIATKYGGVDYSLYQLNKPIAFRILERIKEMIYSFHMPLFMALSGALFYCQLKQNKITSAVKLIKSKAKRLLIPYIFVTVFYSVPLKYLANYWATSSNKYLDIVVGQVLLQGNTYLWFLPTLFVIFIIAYSFLKDNTLLVNYKSILVLIISIILNVISTSIPIMIIQYVFKYFLWFYVGYRFEEKRELINKRNMKLDTVLSGLLFIVAGKDYITEIIEMLLCLIGCYATYAFSKWLSSSNFVKSKCYALIYKNSLGIYLYSDPWNYLFLYLGAKLCGSFFFDSEIGVSLFFVMRFLITGAIAILVSMALRKAKLKYLV
jgi:fucose 4-O-acetylase-like acetyltransferase